MLVSYNAIDIRLEKFYIFIDFRFQYQMGACHQRTTFTPSSSKERPVFISG